MLKKTIKYKDYSGNEREEDFYFNLTKAELAEMELSTSGGLEEKINRIIASQDREELIGLFKSIILDSYGVKSPDGRRFIKNEEVRNDFVQTEAYSVLFMEMILDADAAVAFMTGIIPTDLELKQ